jgi:hypothetical protein
MSGTEFLFPGLVGQSDSNISSRKPKGTSLNSYDHALRLQREASERGHEASGKPKQSGSPVLAGIFSWSGYYWVATKLGEK